MSSHGKIAADFLKREHTDEAIARRLAAAKSHSYLGDFVLGAVDGAVTTFAIVAGAAGAGLSNGIVLVLGLANVLADGFSMAAGNFLRARSDQQLLEQFRLMEEAHIDRIPEGEREEIRQIFRGKGFDGEMLERVVQVITEDRQQWVNTMLTEEWGLRLEPPSPWRAGAGDDDGVRAGGAGSAGAVIGFHAPTCQRILHRHRGPDRRHFLCHWRGAGTGRQ